MDGPSRAAAALVLSLGAMAAVCTLAPRALVFLPAVAGLVAYLATKCWAEPGRSAFFSDCRWPVVFCTVPVALAAASLLWADAPAETWSRVWKTALTLLPSGMFLCALAAAAPDVVRRVAGALPVFVLLATALAAVDLWAGLPLLRALAGVAPGADFDPFHANRGIVVLSIVFFPALAILTREGGRRSRSLLWGGVLCAATAGMLWAGESQSAQMAFILGLAALAAFPVTWKPAWHLLAGALSAAILTAPWAAQAAFRHWSASGGFAIPEANIAPRLEIWDFVARRALEHPWLGSGIEATRRAHFESAQLYFDGQTVLHPHNFALQIWMEFGVFGAVGACAFLAGLLWKISALPPRAARFSLAVFIAALSVAATGYGLWQGWWLGALILFAGWCIVATEVVAPSDTSVREVRYPEAEEPRPAPRIS